MGNLQFLSGIFGSDAKLSYNISEGGLVTHKISKTITHYYRNAPNDDPTLGSTTHSLRGLTTPLTSHPWPSDNRRPSEPPPTPSSTPSARPIALLLPWLGARRDAVAKYRDLYLERGMDVLLVESRVCHFLWPRWGLDYGLEVLRVLEGPRLSGRPVVVHACSIGGYTFATMLTHVARCPEKYACMAQRVKGHIYDSMVAGSLEHMATGLGKTLFPHLESVVKTAAMLYFWLFKAHTADFYSNVLHVFYNVPISTPVLFFFCDNDALCDPATMETVIDLWRRRGVAVERRRWVKSVHAAHLRCHREEYLWTLEKFLSSLPGAQVEATTPLSLGMGTETRY